MHVVHVGRCLGYIIGLLKATVKVPSRADYVPHREWNSYIVPKPCLKNGEHAFSVADQTDWNSLKKDLTNLMVTNLFKFELKMHHCVQWLL